MVASRRLLIPWTRRCIRCWRICCHSRCNAATSSSSVCIGGMISRIFRPRMSHKCSRGFKSGLRAGHGSVEIAFWRKHSITARDLWGLALSSITLVLLKWGWLSKWGITAVSRMSVWYICPVRVPCTVTRSSLQSGDTHPPYHYWASTEKNSFLDVPLRISSISLPPNTHTAIHHIEKKPTFIRPVNFSPRPDIPVPALLAPVQTRCLLSRSKHWPSDRPTSTITRSPKPITKCSLWQWQVWQPSLLHNSPG